MIATQGHCVVATQGHCVAATQGYCVVAKEKGMFLNLENLGLENASREGNIFMALALEASGSP